MITTKLSEKATAAGKSAATSTFRHGPEGVNVGQTSIYRTALNREAPLVDARYYDAAPPNSTGERLLIWARDRIFRDFMRLVAPSPTDRILDVGVSDVVTDGANLIERLYPHRRNITAVGLGEGGDIRQAYPGVEYRRITAGSALPFADGAFDVAVSNAVIEHVGSRTAQKAFMAELTRVAKTVFVTAPNRWFPVEHHTGLPFFHYQASTFAAACRLTGKTLWLDPSELILTSLDDLRAVAPKGRRITSGFTGLPLGPFSSNLYVLIEPVD